MIDAKVSKINIKGIDFNFLYLNTTCKISMLTANVWMTIADLVSVRQITYIDKSPVVKIKYCFFRLYLSHRVTVINTNDNALY